MSNPRKLRSCETFSGCGASTMAWTSVCSFRSPPLLTSCQQYSIRSWKNRYFKMLTRRPTACSRAKTASRLRKCSSSSAPVTMMSSMMHLVFCSLPRTVSIARCQTAGAEAIPNGRRLSRKSPCAYSVSALVSTRWSSPSACTLIAGPSWRTSVRLRDLRRCFHSAVDGIGRPSAAGSLLLRNHRRFERFHSTSRQERRVWPIRSMTRV